MADEDRTAPQGPQDDASQDRIPVTQQLGRIAVIVILVLFAIFAIANFQYVSFSWVFGATEVNEVVRGGEIERQSGGIPLIVLLVVSFVLGAIVGWFLKGRRQTSGE